MPKTSEMRTSKYLQKSDVGNGVLVTVKGCTRENVAMEDEEDKFKWCLHFRETSKPLVLNSTNIQLCEQVFGSDNTDEWAGKPIVLYTDPNVSFGGKLIGGIRVRKPRPRPAQPAAPQPAPLPVEEPPEPLGPLTSELTEDDIPF